MWKKTKINKKMSGIGQLKKYFKASIRSIVGSSNLPYYIAWRLSKAKRKMRPGRDI